MEQTSGPRVRRHSSAFLAVVLGVLGAAQLVSGTRLVLVGGSTYFVIAAAAQLACAWWLWRSNGRARLAAHLLIAGTLAWAGWDTHGHGWGMVSRLAWPLLLWLLVLLTTRTRAKVGSDRRAAIGVAAAATLVSGALLVGHLMAGQQPSSPQTPTPPDFDWHQYGRTLAATRFSPLTQITPDNVSHLEVAWSYRTGDMPRASDAGMEFTFEATPLKVGQQLYLCTPHNIVIALDAETGRERWRFDPRVNDKSSYVKSCRGVSYFKASAPVADCPERILSGTIDGRLIALDAQTGKPCPSFGQDGQISVLHGLGSPPPGFAYLTSPPLIIEGLAVVGGWVLDGWSIDMPSGAVRAYDAVTGKFVWAWDIGRPGDPSEPPPGQTYTPGTPNVWAPMSADPELGLIYLPTGNATPDYWGGYRSKLMDRYSSSVVALDARTGAQRWSFQTVHHDLWDYDVPANPILFEFKRGDERIPALAQVTKSGQIFVLDRRDGRPIHEVTEQPMPQGAGEGDWTSPTQPISSVPSVGPPRLTESSMWGFTPFDQISCRMMFRTHRYEGLYTPATVEGSIFYPSMFGAVDWGAATVDEDHGLLVVNSNWLPFLVRLVPRKEADAIEADAIAHGKDLSTAGLAPQKGTPFGIMGRPMLSTAGIPCTQPPWGLLTAIDLTNKSVAWQVPFGTARDSGPLGSKTGPPITFGVFSMGGPTSTRSGLTFIGASLDQYIRAYDNRTGRELWRARLPAGGQSSPMTYWSDESSRQFVVIAAGGHGALQTAFGDHVIAYALPRTSTR